MDDRRIVSWKLIVLGLSQYELMPAVCSVRRREKGRDVRRAKSSDPIGLSFGTIGETVIPRIRTEQWGSHSFLERV
jgi:hypothetical protein